MRVAVLGQGSIGRRHARNLLDLGHEVVAWDPVADVVAGAHPAESAETALSEADAAIVASPSSEHATQAGLALEHGCHVLVEKPLALSVADTDPLIALADERGLILAVAMNLRFHPGVLAVRAAVSSGTIGQPLVARVWCGSWLPGWRPGTDYRRSYSARRELGGGILLDAIHELDYIVWTLGPVKSVWGRLATVSDLELDVEDVAQLQMTFASGAHCVVSLDYLDRSYDRGCRIAGSEGTAEWSWHACEARILDTAGAISVTEVPQEFSDTYRQELAAFLDAVRGGSQTLASGREGREILRVVEAARAASANGTPQDLG